MSFQLDRGLFQFEFTDRHAILGVGVNAAEADIRDRYQTIARLLHPDSGKWKTDSDRQLAIQIFSRLVTHAYGTLSRPSQREEHNIMLELIGKRLVQEGNKLQIADPLCQQLYQTGNDLDLVYGRLTKQLTTNQYLDISQSIAVVNQLSELNMVYLVRKQLQSVSSVPPTVMTESTTANATNSAKLPGELNKPSPIEGALRRAEEYISKKIWGKAVQELREAISVEPSNARAHALLGIAYLHQQQSTMARLSINKALQLDATHPQVIQAKQEFDRANSGGNRQNNGKAAPKKPGEGMFGGFFGKK